MIKLKTNLFNLAENQLLKEEKMGLRESYTMLDIINTAIKIRKWLDENPKKVKELLNLTEEEKLKRHRQAQARYELRNKK